MRGKAHGSKVVAVAELAPPVQDVVTVLAATSARLLRDHGAELHGAKWDALDVFGCTQLRPPRTHRAGGWPGY